MELSNLTVKKLQSVKLRDNPLADPRIRRFVEDDSPTLVKDLLNHVKKFGFKGEDAGRGLQSSDPATGAHPGKQGEQAQALALIQGGIQGGEEPTQVNGQPLVQRGQGKNSC